MFLYIHVLWLLYFFGTKTTLNNKKIKKIFWYYRGFSKIVFEKWIEIKILKNSEISKDLKDFSRLKNSKECVQNLFAGCT